jgi:hypothetical protein
MTEPNPIASAVRAKRTVVGSGSARKPLPFGTDAEKREAIESVRTPADWLPDELGGLDLAELRELRRGMPS